MPLVTINDLETLARTLSAQEQAAAQLLIDTIEGELELFLHRPLTARAITGERATIGPSGHVFLRHTPVISIQSVNYGTSPSTAYTGAYSFAPGGLVFAPSPVPTEVLVSYTAGLTDPDNRGLKSVVLSRLSRIMAKVHDDALGVSSLTQEGYNAAFLQEGWTEQEMKLAERYRRRIVRP